MTGFGAKSSNKSNSQIDTKAETENLSANSQNLTNELNKLNELLNDGVLTKEEFEKAKKKILDS